MNVRHGDGCPRRRLGVAWGIEPHVALDDALQGPLSELRGVRFLDITEER
jgi:hypothetical protein